MVQKNHLLLAIGIGGFFILLDQALKYVARTHTGVAIYLWKPYLGWEYFANPGIAFSLPFPNWLILIVTPLILLGITAFLLWHKQPSLWYIYGTSVVISGAISNYIDRMLFGITIDYLRLFTSIINLGDVGIVAGVLCILIAESKTKKPPESRVTF